MERLEERVDSGVQIDSRAPTFYQRAKEATTSYLVDYAAGSTFYNPIMALGEHFIAGMSGKEVLKARIGASVMHALFFRPMGMLRNASAQYFELDSQSPWYKKTTSDVLTTLAVQMPTYSLALNLSGASLKEGIAALLVGAGITAVSGRFFGMWMDGFRKFFGKKPAYR